MSHRTDIAERLDQDHAPAWRPAPGDKLVGAIVDITEYDAGYGVYPVLSIRQPDGTVFAVHAFHSVLRSELARARPKVGEIIGIKYDGRREGKTAGAPAYHSYRVAVDRGEPASVDWAKYSDPQDTLPIKGDVPSDVPAAASGDDGIPF